VPLLPRRHPCRTCTNVAHDSEGAGYAEGGNMAIEDPWVENGRHGQCRCHCPASPTRCLTNLRPMLHRLTAAFGTKAKYSNSRYSDAMR
jgi:hypothetical protein